MNTRAAALAILLSLLSFLDVPFPLFAQSSGACRSLAVMDLETSGVPEAQMREIVDALTRGIRETGAVRRVVDRQQREKRASRRGEVEPGGRKEQDQLAAAAALKLDLAVLGTLTWNRQQYALRLQLVEVESGKVLYEQGGAYRNRGELLAACSELANRIGAAAAEAGARMDAQREKRDPIDLFPGFSVGQVGVSAGSTVAGGSYFYARSLLMFNRNLGLDARYAFRIFPTIWEDQLLSAGLLCHVPLGTEALLVVEGAYLFNFDGKGNASHLIGARLSPLAGGEEEFLFELLPVALYFDLDTGEAVFMLELLALVVFLPH